MNIKKLKYPWNCLYSGEARVRGRVFVAPSFSLFEDLAKRPEKFMQDSDLLKKMRTNAGWHTTHLHHLALIVSEMHSRRSSLVMVNSLDYRWTDPSVGSIDLVHPAPPPSPEALEALISNLAKKREFDWFERIDFINHFMATEVRLSPRDFSNATQMLIWMGLPLHIVYPPSDPAEKTVQNEYFLIRRMLASFPNDRVFDSKGSMLGPIEGQLLYGIPYRSNFLGIDLKTCLEFELSLTKEEAKLTHEQMVELILLHRHLRAVPTARFGLTEFEKLVGMAQRQRKKRSILGQLTKKLTKDVLDHLEQVKNAYREPDSVLMGEFLPGERLASVKEFTDNMIELVPGLDEFPDTLKILKETFELMSDLPPTWHLQWDYAEQKWANLPQN